MAKIDLTAELLREHLQYDAGTGGFTWRSNRNGTVRAGAIAGSLNVRGYQRIGLLGGAYLAHRLAWLYVHGRWPEDHIDHRNGNRADNRIANLRECTISENNQNFPVPCTNTSGLIGARWHKRDACWEAHIRVDGRQRHLGNFDTAEDAHAAYLAAKEVLHTFQPTVRALFAQNALPPSYDGSTLLTRRDGTAGVTFEFSDAEQAEVWHDTITARYEAAHSTKGGV